MSLKTAMMLWMHEMEEFLNLKRRDSHGFRAAFQAAGVHVPPPFASVKAGGVRRQHKGLQGRHPQSL